MVPILYSLFQLFRRDNLATIANEEKLQNFSEKFGLGLYGLAKFFKLRVSGNQDFRRSLLFPGIDEFQHKRIRQPLALATAIADRIKFVASTPHPKFTGITCMSTSHLPCGLTRV